MYLRHLPTNNESAPGRTETAGQADLNESILPQFPPKRRSRGLDFTRFYDDIVYSPVC